MVDLISNGRERRPLIRGHHGKLMRLAHLERDSPREDPAESDRFDDAAQRGDDPPLADELSQPAPCDSCGALPVNDPPLLAAYLAAHECGCHWPGNHWRKEDQAERIRRVTPTKEEG